MGGSHFNTISKHSGRGISVLTWLQFPPLAFLLFILWPPFTFSERLALPASGLPGVFAQQQGPGFLRPP